MPRPKERRSSLQLDYIKLHRNTRIGYLFVIPSLLVVIFVLVYPVIQAFLYSLTPEYREDDVWSLENYFNLLDDNRFIESFNNTLIFTFFTAFFSLSVHAMCFCFIIGASYYAILCIQAPTQLKAFF